MCTCVYTYVPTSKGSASQDVTKNRICTYMCSSVEGVGCPLKHALCVSSSCTQLEVEAMMHVTESVAI